MVSITQVLSSIFVAYILYSIWSLYSLFQTRPCVQSAGNACISPYLRHKHQLKLAVYTSTFEDFYQSKADLVWTSEVFDCDDGFEKTVDVKIPLKTRQNGTLYAHVFLSEASSNTEWKVKKSTKLTAYAIPQAATFQLMGNGTQEKKNVSKLPESHWNSKLIINIVNEVVALDRQHITSDLAEHLMLRSSKEYFPILFLDEVSIRIKDLMPLNESCKEMPLKIIYSPISMGKLKFWTNMKQSMVFFKEIGFSEKDVDEVKNIFVDINLYLLLLTFFVSAFHLLFDFLAFKNDISFWRKRKNMIGLSTRTMVWRCFSTLVIFLYLLDEQTSLLVLIPSGIGLIIEIWKLLKAFKVTFEWSGWRPVVKFGSTAESEADTEAFDAQAMKWLLYVLYPLVICGAVYSLIYTPHKSWYSWTIQSMANGVYAFGFIFMLPQLFINYKLKSVAHLPWKAFTYKAFNTFIDDVFAFIITMPTTHRLACFRDDIVFVIYLYQRWLYPVDKTRVNEFGQSFDEVERDEAAEKKKSD